jgi:UDP-N-acetylenolpyruvoylglucosamine reductase
VNAGGGTAGQVRELIERGREVVKEQFGVQLETEIEYLSDNEGAG